MRSKVPQHIHVMLEQSQIDAGRVVVIEGSEGTFVNQVLNFSDSTCKEERMIHHNLQILAVCKLDKLFRLGRRRSERLFYEHMLAVLKGFLGEVIVVRHRGYNCYSIDFCRRDDIIHFCRNPHTRMSAQDSCQCRRVLVAYGHDFAVLMRGEIADDVWPPISVTNYAESNHGSLLPQLRPWIGTHLLFTHC